MGRLAKKRVKEAIPKSAGIMSTIAQRLGCAWNTADAYIKADPELSQMLADEVEGVLDMAESVVFKSAQGGDTQSAKWLLSKKGKQRGYGDSVDMNHRGRIDFGSLSDAELEAIASGQGSGGA
jgi:hypothetical protein